MSANIICLAVSIAYPLQEFWDEPSGKIGSGRRFFHNRISGVQFVAQPFYVAIIAPVISCCMCGLEIDENPLVQSRQTQPILGLYAADEVADVVHSNNQQERNSLQDRFVFGSVAGNIRLFAQIVPLSRDRLS